MVKRVRLAWSIFGSEAPFALIASDLETELPLWDGCEDNAPAAVNAICARYFVDAMWERLFGLEFIEAEILFEIAAPANVAGMYEVALRRIATAKCRKVSDPRFMRLPQSLDRPCPTRDANLLALIEQV